MGFHYNQCMLVWDIEYRSIETKFGCKCLVMQYNKFVVYMSCTRGLLTKKMKHTILSVIFFGGSCKKNSHRLITLKAMV